MIALRDQFAPAAPVALSDQARGSAVAGLDGGTMTVTVTGAAPAPSTAALLIEDGASRLLLEDGASKLLLEA